MAVLSLDSDPATVREVREMIERVVQNATENFRDEVEMLRDDLVLIRESAEDLAESVNALKESVAMLASLAEVAEATRP